jgi:hypothetical protein
MSLDLHSTFETLASTNNIGEEDGDVGDHAGQFV